MKDFTHQFTSNFAKRSWYDTLQNSTGSSVEAAWWANEKLHDDVDFAKKKKKKSWIGTFISKIAEFRD